VMDVYMVDLVWGFVVDFGFVSDGLWHQLLYFWMYGSIMKYYIS